MNSNICCPDFFKVYRGFSLREALKEFANEKEMACPTPCHLSLPPPPSHPRKQVRCADEITRQAAVLANQQQMMELVKPTSGNHIKDLNVGGNAVSLH